jgi:hypothetical protein
LDSDTNDGFIDIDEFLLDMQQRNTTPKSTAEKTEIGFASGSLAAFSQPIEENTHGEHTLIFHFSRDFLLISD